MTNPVNLNEEMQKLADFAANAAKERFGHHLDFSESSLQQLESLLELAYQRLVELKQKGTLTEEAILKTAQIWGSYLGEVIRRKWGGNWGKHNLMSVIAINGLEIFPSIYVRSRITDSPTFSTKMYYDSIVAQIKSFSQQNQIPKTDISLLMPEAGNPSPSSPETLKWYSQERLAKHQNSRTKSINITLNKKRLYVLVIGLVVITLLVSVVVGIVIILPILNNLEPSQKISSQKAPASNSPSPTPYQTITKTPYMSPTFLPTSKRLPMATDTPIPSIYPNNASNYILKEEDMARGFVLQTGSSGSAKGQNLIGFLSGYHTSYKNDNILNLLEPTGYSIDAYIIVYDGRDSALQEFNTQANDIPTERSDYVIKLVGSANIANCDQSNLYLGVRDLDGLIVVQGVAVFQKNNVVGILSIIGAAGAPSMGIPIDVETASNIRIKEIKYYGEIMTTKIK